MAPPYLLARASADLLCTRAWLVHLRTILRKGMGSLCTMQHFLRRLAPGARRRFFFSRSRAFSEALQSVRVRSRGARWHARRCFVVWPTLGDVVVHITDFSGCVILPLSCGPVKPERFHILGITHSREIFGISAVS